MMKTDIVDIEYDLWRDLCGRLEESGLVSSADLKSPASELRTDGQRLLHAIRAWGEDHSNDIARRTVTTLCRGNEYVLTAVREWGRAAAMLTPCSST